MYAGELVRLRAIEPEQDGPAYHRWFHDADVIRYLAPRYPRSLAAMRERMAEWAPYSFASARFSVVRRDGGELVGFAALRDAEPENRDAELDLVIGEKSAWGQGLGGDTIRTLCRFGFAEMGLHRIHLYVFADHAAAIRVYERAGFTREGVVRHAFYKRGAWHDCLLMGMLDGELLTGLS